MVARQRIGLKTLTVATGIAALGACATPPPPPLPPPPPPQAIVIPPRPTPPLGAVAAMVIPARDAMGVRMTVNRNISPEQELWNVRSGLNVAALNCLRPQHSMLVSNYGAFLKRHSRELASVNRKLADEYRQKHGRRFRDQQDSYMTQVYNYFALPPILPEFCDAALELSNEAIQVPSGKLADFSTTALPRLEAVFENFFSAYEKYRVDLAAWDSRYGTSIPGTSYAAPVGNLNATYGPRISTATPPASTAQQGGNQPTPQ